MRSLMGIMMLLCALSACGDLASPLDVTGTQTIYFNHFLSNKPVLSSIETDGSNHRVVIQNALTDSVQLRMHSWRFASTHANYLLLSGIDEELYSLEISSGSLAELATRSERAITASVSPNGTKVAYTTFEGLFIVNMDGSGKATVDSTVSSSITAPRFTNDGQQLLYIDGRSISLINTDGSDEQLILDLAALNGIAGDLRFGPDETTIYFRGDVDVFGQVSILYRMNADGSGLTALSDHTRVSSYDISAAAGKIAFVGDTGITGRLDDVFLMNLDGSDLQNLTVTDDSELNVRFSPGGRFIAFSKTASNSGHNLFLIDVTDGSVSNLTNPLAGSHTSPVFSLQ